MLKEPVDCPEHALKFLRILVDVQQRYGAVKLRLVKRDHVPQSALRKGWSYIYIGIPPSPSALGA